MKGHRTYLEPKVPRPTIIRNDEIIEAVLRAKRRGVQEDIRVAA